MIYNILLIEKDGSIDEVLGTSSNYEQAKSYAELWSKNDAVIRRRPQLEIALSRKASVELDGKEHIFIRPSNQTPTNWSGFEKFSEVFI